MPVSFQSMKVLEGYKFPGGSFRIEHWENFLIHDLMLVPQSSNGLAHPLYLFHAPLAGLGLKIAEIFKLCFAESDEAVRAGEYIWEINTPLREEQTYLMQGTVTSVVRKHGKRGGLMDFVTFVIDINNGETLNCDARVTNTWIFMRRDES